MSPRHLIAATACALATGHVAAGTSYFGVELSRERLKFEPHYYLLDGTPDGSFTNRARGTGGALFGGHRWSLGSAFSLAVEARLAANDAKWTLRLPDEPATFRYSVPLSAGLVLQPTAHLSDQVSVYAEGGVAMAQVRERKSAPATSAYNVSRWRNGTILGAGVNVKVGEGWTARLGYRESRYAAVRYTARLSDGTPVERIRDKPVQTGWYLGLARTF